MDNKNRYAKWLPLDPFMDGLLSPFIIPMVKFWVEQKIDPKLFGYALGAEALLTILFYLVLERRQTTVRRLRATRTMWRIFLIPSSYAFGEPSKGEASIAEDAGEFAFIDVEAGGLVRDKSHAGELCPQVAALWQKNNQAFEATWAGEWAATVEDSMSTCTLKVKPGSAAAPGTEVHFDLEAGPIFSHDHAKELCENAVAQWNEKNPAYSGRWNGHWVTTVDQNMSVCGTMISIKQ